MCGLSASALSELETNLISCFRQLDSIGKGRILERIDMMLSIQNK